MTVDRDDITKSDEGLTQEMTSPDHTVIIDVPRELGCYRLTRLLGRGGMGEVWQALDTHLERDVAIKLMRKEMISNEDAVRRFTREARAVARLNHPNIVQVYAFGDEKGMAYMVMELVEGETIAQCLKRRCKITIEDALHVTLQAIEGLSYANARGIIHRDIKPSNLMLTEDHRVKIADFGLAKMIEHDTQMTAAGTAMGSPNYMSPEQARGEEADHRCDIYALGISLYQMLLGELPFTAHSPVSVLLKQIQDPLPEPEELKALGNGEIMAVLKKMTEKAPEKRYQTYGEVAHALATLQPNLKFKGAHIATASMPAANTPTHSPTLTAEPDPAGKHATLATATDAAAEPSASVLLSTQSEQSTYVEPSRVSTGTPAIEATRKPHKMLVPVLAGITLILVAIPVLLVVFADGDREPFAPPDDTTSVMPGDAENAQATQILTPAPTATATQPQATSVAAAQPTPANTAVTALPGTGSMQSVDITAVFTPNPTPQPGVPTTVTPLPDIRQMLPATSRVTLGGAGFVPGTDVALYDASGNAIGSAPAGTETAMVRPATLNGREWYVIRHKGGEAFVPKEQAAATRKSLPPAPSPAASAPAPVVYILGTAGASKDEQVPTFIDRNGRTTYKSFPAGTEVNVIDAGVTMLRAQAPDDKIVYIYRKMASPKQ